MADKRLGEIARNLLPLPIHPRTKARLNDFELLDDLPPGIRIVDPVGYLDILRLESRLP